jgi:hypothetical protein
MTLARRAAHRSILACMGLEIRWEAVSVTLSVFYLLLQLELRLFTTQLPAGPAGRIAILGGLSIDTGGDWPHELALCDSRFGGLGLYEQAQTQLRPPQISLSNAHTTRRHQFVITPSHLSPASRAPASKSRSAKRRQYVSRTHNHPLIRTSKPRCGSEAH